MYLFIDTEFVPSESGKSLLLSIGLCGPRAEEFYAEHEVQVDAGVDPFISDHVLPQLGHGGCVRGTLTEIGDALLHWLRQFQGQPLELCYDFHVDRATFEELLHLAQTAHALEVSPCHLGYLLEDEDGAKAADACWAELSRTRGVGRHHALADALALRSRFAAVHGFDPQPVGDQTPINGEVKCPRCGWVHASISLSTAMVSGESDEQLARYFRCFRCKNPSETFVRAHPDDAPVGCSLQPVVVGNALQVVHWREDEYAP
jgi:hypothetical protein